MAWALINGKKSLFKKSKRAFFVKAFLACALCVNGTGASAAVFSPKTFTLGNGMQVIVVTNRLSPAIAQMVWYKVGAVDDPEGRSGTAHYLEHMMFKGTPTIPEGAFSRIVAAQGGSENAFTTRDYTAYHEEIAADRLGMVMQMEADRMRNLLIDPKEAAPELAVVLSERQERTDNTPQGRFAEKMAAALYGKHPYGRPVIGWREDIERISRDDAYAFYRRHYAPNNAILVISGNVDVPDVMRLAAGTFGRLDPEPGLARSRLPALEKPKQKRVEMQDKRIRQPSVVHMIALDDASVSLKRGDALEVLGEVLTGGEVGLLHRHFVMDKKSAASIDTSFAGVSRGPKSFSIAATPSPGQDIRALENEVMAYVKGLSQSGLSSREVEAAKKRMLDSAVFARDRLVAPAQILGATAAMGRPLSDVEDWPARIAAISVDDVNAAFRVLLRSPYQVTGILESAPKEGK